ncbi:MAG: hypothetical protein ACRCXZ_04760 [Patescibacteria group bacterium]
MMCIPIEVFVPVIVGLLILLGYYEGKLNENETLLNYYRQPGIEITATSKMTQHNEPVCLSVIWQNDTGKLKVLTSYTKELEIFIPEEDAEWKMLDKDNDFSRSLMLFQLIGHKNVLFKLRCKDQICFK